MLNSRVLNVVYELSGRVSAPSRGGPNERFLSASAEPAEGCRRQIFGGRGTRPCGMKMIFEKNLSGMVKASRHPRFMVRTGAPE